MGTSTGHECNGDVERGGSEGEGVWGIVGGKVWTLEVAIERVGEIQKNAPRKIR